MSEVQTQVSTDTASTVTVTEKKSPGRPIDPNSARQKKLAEKKENPAKKGRPIVPGSVRQIRLAAMEEKRQNGTLKRGRPKMSEEAKAKAKAEREAAKAAAKASVAA